MCIDAPARVLAIEDEGASALVDSRGSVHHVSLVLLELDDEPVRPGDWLLTNSGIAVRVIDEVEAKEMVAMFDEAEVPR